METTNKKVHMKIRQFERVFKLNRNDYHNIKARWINLQVTYSNYYTSTV